MKRILVATDGSPSAMEAVAFGVELAAEHGSELMFVHVVPVVDVVPATGFAPISGAFPHDLSEHDRTLLVEAAEVAAEQGIVATTVLLRGDTVDEIVAFADSHDVDLIVVGSRGRGAIAGALLGQRVARDPRRVEAAGADRPRHDGARSYSSGASSSPCVSA